MKVFVATKEGQGKRKNDFCFCEEEELVSFAFECDDEGVDGSCGCRRSMSGLTTLKATTTFKVKEIDITMDQYAERIHEKYKRGGWCAAGGFVLKDCIDEAKELVDYANSFTTGKVLEKRGNVIQERK